MHVIFDQKDNKLAWPCLGDVSWDVLPLFGPIYQEYRSLEIFRLAATARCGVCSIWLACHLFWSGFPAANMIFVRSWNIALLAVLA